MTAFSPQSLMARQLKQAQREIVRAALEHCGGNRSAAARYLGISRTHVWRMCRGLDLPLPPSDTVRRYARRGVDCGAGL